MLQIKDFKGYVIWIIIWISFLFWYSFASSGTIGSLFTLVWSDYKLIGSNIQNGTVWNAQLWTNSVDNNKLNNSASYTMAWLQVWWSVRANSFLYTSDERLKEDIVTLDDALERVKLLRGVEFDWKNNNQHDIWFIAQEVETIAPELVFTDENGYKSVKYGNIVWLLVEAMKQQQEQIEFLEEKLNNR